MPPRLGVWARTTRGCDDGAGRGEAAGDQKLTTGQSHESILLVRESAARPSCSAFLDGGERLVEHAERLVDVGGGVGQ